MLTRMLLLVVTALLGGFAHASEINRCQSAEGILVYTDQSCAALGISERRTPFARRRVGQLPIVARRDFSCSANTPAGLRAAVVTALDQGDFNALAGLYNFDGRSRWTAAPVVRRLERMAKRSALEVEIVERQPESWSETIAMVESGELPTLRVVQYGTSNAQSLNIEQFRMARSAGCLWLAD